MKSKSLFLITMLTTLALLLAACAGSDGQSSANEFTVEVRDEFSFDPSTLTVQPGQEVTINFHNTGSVEHTFNVLKADASLDHVKEEIGNEEHLHEELLFDIHETAPGATESGSFTAPQAPGEYTIVCLVPGHADAGMVATLNVSQ